VGELRERPDGLLELRRSGSRRIPRLPGPRLLGPYEPVLLGWCSRDFLAGAHDVVLVRNGLFRPFALVGGRAVATWRMPGGQVELEPLEPLGEGDRRALAADAEAVRRYLGL
jgi:hypothetical protein